MKEFYIRDAATFENQNITTSFVVANKQVKAKKSGEPYLALTLVDRTGQIEAKVWDGVPEIMETFDQDDFVKVKGLLDHVVSLFRSAYLVCRNYPQQIDRDLLLTGVFLHDIGKIHELSYARSFGYTDRGQLLGHMIIELEMLQAKILVSNQHTATPFPDELKTMVEHLIISHHGKYEFGSPKLPMFPEALMLHYIDDLDSKLKRCARI